MDKASIIRDAIAYIERLQEEERRMLAEIAALESSASALVKTEDAAVAGRAADDADSFVPWTKKPRVVPVNSDTRAAPPVQILEVLAIITLKLSIQIYRSPTPPIVRVVAPN